jgi:hypothetical protein
MEHASSCISNGTRAPHAHCLWMNCSERAEEHQEKTKKHEHQYKNMHVAEGHHLILKKLRRSSAQNVNMRSCVSEFYLEHPSLPATFSRSNAAYNTCKCTTGMGFT